MQLRFRFYPNTEVPEGEFDWVAQCEVGAFMGFQTFIVDQTDFSADVPILYFAHSLRVASWKFNQGIQDFTHYDVDSQWEVYFKKKNDIVEISDNHTPPRIGIVLFLDFISASEAYAQDVYGTCCVMCPELKERVGGWWNFQNEQV
jgi:hypothetical protein